MENEFLFKFPNSLPNDLGDFTLYYPKKFPLIRKLYKELVEKTHMNPKLFRETCLELQKELFQGFEKIKKEFNNCKTKDLKFLVRTDQRLHKLFCYRFWIINYLFCDGPLHKHYTDKLKEFSEKIAEWDDPEEKEKKVLEIERTLFHSDYADLYLKNSFKGIKIYNLLHKIQEIKPILNMLKKSLEDNKKAYKLIDNILETIGKSSSEKSKEFFEIIKTPMETAKVRGDNLMVYNLIMHSLEFIDESIKLKQKYDETKQRLDKIFNIAENKLSKDEFIEFSKVYQMCRNFIEAKDIFGIIDPELLPFWFSEVFGRIGKFLPDVEYQQVHPAVFRDFVWGLPNELKAEIMTPDLEPFTLETL